MGLRLLLQNLVGCFGPPLALNLLQNSWSSFRKELKEFFEGKEWRVDALGRVKCTRAKLHKCIAITILITSRLRRETLT